MNPDPESSAIWQQLQGVLEALLTIAAGVFGFVTKYTFDEIRRLRDQLSAQRRESENHAEKGDGALWTAVDEIRRDMKQVATREEVSDLRDSIHEERKAASGDRATIMTSVISKPEMERQMDTLYTRLVHALGRHP